MALNKYPGYCIDCKANVGSDHGDLAKKNGKFVITCAKSTPEARAAHNSIHELAIMAKSFGETVRELREAQGLGLREAAEQLEISPPYLSRIERGREKPPRPELVGRIAGLFGGDADMLFRLAQSTDPELAEYVNSVPKVPEFLRTAMAARLSSEDFQELIDQIKKPASRKVRR